MSMLEYRGFKVAVDEKEFTFLTGKVFRGLSITPRDTHWALVLRAWDTRGQPVYCMIEQDDLYGIGDTLMDILAEKNPKMGWHFDRYA